MSNPVVRNKSNFFSNQEPEWGKLCAIQPNIPWYYQAPKEITKFQCGTSKLVSERRFYGEARLLPCRKPTWVTENRYFLATHFRILFPIIAGDKPQRLRHADRLHGPVPVPPGRRDWPAGALLGPGEPQRDVPPDQRPERSLIGRHPGLQESPRRRHAGHPRGGGVGEFQDLEQRGGGAAGRTRAPLAGAQGLHFRHRPVQGVAVFFALRVQGWRY